MVHRLEVTARPGVLDARGASLLGQIRALGIAGVRAVHVSDLYFLDGALDDAALVRLTDTLLVDPVVETVAAGDVASAWDGFTVEVALRPGVTDSVAESLLAGVQMAGIAGLTAAATGHRYRLEGKLTEADVHRVAGGLLANDVVQTYAVNRPVAPPFVPVQAVDETVEVVPLIGVDDAGLEAVSRARRLSLDVVEMRAIEAWFRAEGREPTDVELEMLAQTWSEHCVHKSFRALITCEETERDGARRTRVVDSLLKSYIRAATETVAKPWVHSAFVDNAGIVAFDDAWDLAFKVETHNHPSALEPFGGANTGVGGVVRDVIGVSARPIATTDVLCFGPLDSPFEALPAGVLHPRRIQDGVTAGIEDYGNKMGIPTVSGAIIYDPGYTANPLVYCGCLGILPRGAHRTEAQPGDLVVVIGGRTGRDGLRGATFSSMEMTHETGQIAGSAVQIGHPIHEKQCLEAVLIARDEGLYTAVTDCGAGGLSSAVGEMGARLGAEIHVERVPLKYAGLRPWEVWLSEAQERMVLAVPPPHWARVEELCDGLDVAATVLGTFTGDGRLTLRWGARVVARLSMDFLHHGIPRKQMTARWSAPAATEPALPCPASLAADLLALLAAPDTRSKEDVVRRYDHEVQGGTVVKPFTGAGEHGPSDAAVLAPLEPLRESVAAGRAVRGVALSVAINPGYGALDPYAMAWAAVDEAVRNVVAVGADPDYVSLLDNFCWGNPRVPDRLGSLVRAARGCHDAAVAFGAPFVSGKDSLNNEYVGADGQKHAIPGTLLISAIGIVPDVARCVTMEAKEPHDRLYLLGSTADELGASSYYRRHGALGTNVPQPVPAAPALCRALHAAMRAGLVRACHDCSEGGLLVAAAEMALAARRGLELELARVPRAEGVTRDDTLAFSESLARFVVEVAPCHVAAFEALVRGFACADVGAVRDDARFVVHGTGGGVVLDVEVAQLEHAWRE